MKGRGNFIIYGLFKDNFFFSVHDAVKDVGKTSSFHVRATLLTFLSFFANSFIAVPWLDDPMLRWPWRRNDVKSCLEAKQFGKRYGGSGKTKYHGSMVRVGAMKVVYDRGERVIELAVISINTVQSSWNASIPISSVAPVESETAKGNLMEDTTKEIAKVKSSIALWLVGLSQPSRYHEQWC